METNRMTITDDSGQEREITVLLSFDDDEHGLHFVLFQDPEDENGEVFAYTYDEDGNMNAVSDPEQLAMCEEVLQAVQEEENDGEKA